MRAPIVCAALAIARIATAESAELATEVEARILKTAEAELGRVERALRTQPGVDGPHIVNITMPLQLALEEDLGHGPVKLYPRAIYEACLQRLRNGQNGDAIGKTLVELHRKGELQRAAAASLVETRPGEPPGVKRVASFVFDKERLRSPDPHLPPNIRAAAGEKLKGVYLICVGTDGKISKVSTVQSIGGGDDFVMSQLQATWLYKPQPVPVCTTRAFVFQFD